MDYWTLYIKDLSIFQKIQHNSSTPPPTFRNTDFESGELFFDILLRDVECQPHLKNVIFLGRHSGFTTVRNKLIFRIDSQKLSIL
mgnify:CR=1 FL=1